MCLKQASETLARCSRVDVKPLDFKQTRLLLPSSYRHLWRSTFTLRRGKWLGAQMMSIVGENKSTLVKNKSIVVIPNTGYVFGTVVSWENEKPLWRLMKHKKRGILREASLFV